VHTDRSMGQLQSTAKAVSCSDLGEYCGQEDGFRAVMQSKDEPRAKQPRPGSAGRVSAQRSPQAASLAAGRPVQNTKVV
jgi:hypothetical protein